jgi:PAS domain-containing protein/DNA-binding CsgD family transcriptional regulator
VARGEASVERDGDGGQPAPRPIWATTHADLEAALKPCEFPVVVWDLRHGVVRLVNDAASAMFDRPAALLLGARTTDLLGPTAAVEQTLATLDAGVFDRVRSERVVKRRNDDGVTVQVWARVIDVDGERVGVSIFVPLDQIGRLGRDPAVPWRDLAPVAVGKADPDWRIRVVSAEIRDLLGEEPSDVVGRSLLDEVHPDDVAQFVANATSFEAPHPDHGVRFRCRDGGWTPVCALVAPLSGDAPAELAFARMGIPRLPVRANDRVAELELRLRHIAAEIRAARVLDDIESLPAVTDRPEVGELTSRQWEILSRLLHGDRVATIAKDLFVSQSTVRNHLAGIYARFGVHSQAELLAELRKPRR